MKIIEGIRKELRAKIDEDYREGSVRFFKEEIKPYGVRSAEVKKIAVRHWLKVKNMKKKEIWRICEELWKSGWFEEGSIAINWSFRMKAKYEKSDMRVFERWLKKYIKNWAHDDVFCTSSVGEMLVQFPELLNKVDRWAESRNRWLRRAAAVSLIYPIMREKYLDKALEIADKLLKDKDDLVQKGYGWMLKKMADLYPMKVFDFVMERKMDMPRTALRYAIEKMPKDWKTKAMAK
jgi:3-methyladenine DNA glycosylase AlkD